MGSPWTSCCLQDIVFAQAAVESWWQQDTLGGWSTDASTCPPGHKLGQDGKPGECPHTHGILQNTYGPGGWPAIARSMDGDLEKRRRSLSLMDSAPMPVKQEI